MNLFKKILILLGIASSFVVGGIVIERTKAEVIPIKNITIDGVTKNIDKTDDNTNETFIIHSDANSYSLNDDKNIEVIIGVTNLRSSEYGTIKLKYSKGESIVKIEKGTQATTTKSFPVFTDTLVPCPSITTGICYSSEQTGTTTKQVSSMEWSSISLANASAKENPNIKQSVGSYDKKEVRYNFPQGTTFFKVTINYPSKLGEKDKFYIEIFGEKGGYGMLDPIITDLRNYWKLDESSGNASDSQGSDTLTNTGTITYSAGKINNGAVNNKDNTKYLSKADPLGWTGASSNTWSFWLKATTFENYLWDLDNKTFVDATHGRRLILYGDTNHYHFFASGNEVVTGTLATSTYYMITITRSGSTYELFVNGVSQGTTTMGSLNYASYDFFFLLNSGNAGGAGGNAQIDEFGHWTRVLTGSEITSLYGGGAGLAYPFSTDTSVTESALIW